MTHYPRGWITSGNHAAFWGRAAATYQHIDAARLPPLSIATGDTTFAWLPALADDDDEPLTYAGHAHTDADDPEHDHDHADDHEHVHRSESLANLARVETEATRLGLQIPDDALRFLRDPQLYARVPTNTACYLDISRGLLTPPGGAPGKIVRFLNDQQVVVLWYLHLHRDGGHSVVAAQPRWRDDAEPDDDDDSDNEANDDDLDALIDLDAPIECSRSFAEFVQRFWIENTIWYALTYRRALSPAQRDYLRHIAG